MKKLVMMCPSNGCDIRCEVLIPDGEGPFPLVIYSHGLGYNTQFVSLYDLCTLGIACCSFDFPGGLPGSRSGGDSTSMSVLTEAADLEAVLDMMRTQPYIDKTGIVLCGASQGGYVSAIAGVRRQADIAGMVLYCPAFVIRDFDTYFLHGQLSERMTFGNMTLSMRYIKDGKAFDLETLRDFKKPVWCYQGTDDEAVPAEYSKMVTDRVKGSRLIMLEGAGHMLMRGNEERLVWDMKRFVSSLSRQMK